MSTLLVALALLVFSGAGTHVVGPRLLREADPRYVIGFSLASLSAVALGLLVVLTATVDLPGVPSRDLPQLVGRCADAATQILSHPVAHWPRIGAAVLLLGLLGRVGFVFFVTARDASRQRKALLALEGAQAGRRISEVVIVRADQPIAITAGILRRRVVMSDGLLNKLSAAERNAVVAHERAHARGFHATLLLFARVVGRAFPFLPPVRLAADHLHLGLEMAADRAAAREVESPLAVANALVAVAALSSGRSSQDLSALGSELEARVCRLTEDVGASRRSWYHPGLALGSMGAASLVLLLLLPLSAKAAEGGVAFHHAACGLPHSPAA